MNYNLCLFPESEDTFLLTRVFLFPHVCHTNASEADILSVYGVHEKRHSLRFGSFFYQTNPLKASYLEMEGSIIGHIEERYWKLVSRLSLLSVCTSYKKQSCIQLQHGGLTCGDVRFQRLFTGTYMEKLVKIVNEVIIKTHEHSKTKISEIYGCHL